jgi:hypothetical protein
LNDSNVDRLKPILTWEESAGAIEYRVRMKNDTDDTRVLKLNSISSTICDVGICTLDTSLFTYLVPLEDGESYVWKVQGRNSYGKQKSNQKLTFNIVLSSIQSAISPDKAGQIQLPQQSEAAK